MCTQCKDEVSVNKAFELQQHTEYVVNNSLNLQRDMVELNFLLKSADRRTVSCLVISANITSLIELEEGNVESEKLGTEVVTGERKSPYINETKLCQISVLTVVRYLVTKKVNTVIPLICKKKGGGGGGELMKRKNNKVKKIILILGNRHARGIAQQVE
jgi:hypothetical protein